MSSVPVSQWELSEVTSGKLFHESRWWNNEYTSWQIALLDTNSWNCLDYIILLWLWWDDFLRALLNPWIWIKRKKWGDKRKSWVTDLYSAWSTCWTDCRFFSLLNYLPFLSPSWVYSYVHIKWWNKIPRSLQQGNQFTLFLLMIDIYWCGLW